MWTLLVVLLFVAKDPGATPLFGHQIEWPGRFESEAACNAFRDMLRKKIPTDFGLREVPEGEPGPGYRVGTCEKA